MTDRTETQFVIIGAGAGGICAAIRLQQTGRDDYVILEKGDGIGGTWYRNTYPGAECDIASHLYSYSFAPSPDWSKPYGTQPEIQAYLERVAHEYGVADRIRLRTGVRSATWDEQRGRWSLVLDTGEALDAQYVISAVGMFGGIAVPAIPGLSDFGGTMFHSATWNHDHDLTGDRIAVIGSAASAVQFIPEIAPLASKLHVFQRTANWVLPKDDTPYTPEQKKAFRLHPELMEERRRQLFETTETSLNYVGRQMSLAETVGLKALEIVDDPEVRRLLTPDHPFGCKRPLLSNRYFPTFNRPNVELVVTGIDHITDDAVVTTDGVERTVDTIVLATGFETTRYASAIEFTGRNGVRLADAWKDGAEAYLGITTSGFPNLFILYGPNTNGGNSIILMLEHQLEHVIRLLDALDANHAGRLDVRREVMDAYNDALQEVIDSVEVWQASCNGYYRAPSGRIVTQWPYNFGEYRARTEADDLASYDIGPVPVGG